MATRKRGAGGRADGRRKGGAVVGEIAPAPEKGRRKAAPKTPRTATGKKMDASTLAQAAQESREGLRERTEEGHLAAGRTPPSQQEATRVSGPRRVQVDESIRDYIPLVTEDEKLLASSQVGSSRVDLQACKLEYSIVSPK